MEASKIATRKLTDEYQKTAALPREMPVFTEHGVELFTDAKNAAVLTKQVNGRAHAGRISQGASRPNERGVLFCPSGIYRDERGPRGGVAGDPTTRSRSQACLEFGPRFLHSTGQAYKGGPNTGVFLQITCDDAVDLPVPGRRYTFGVVKAARTG